MLTTIKIENFRGFQSFSLQELGRVNLLVGANNSGKTSILEAVQLLNSRVNLEAISEAMNRRGEFFFGDDSSRTHELDVRHLFYGHKIEPGSQFSISGMSDSILEKLVVSIDDHPTGLKLSSDFDSNDELHRSLRELFNHIIVNDIIDEKTLNLAIKWTREKEEENIKRPLSANGGLNEEDIRRLRLINTSKKVTKRTQFVTSSSLTTERMIELFEQVVLTPEEKLLQEALQIIEPKIERIASVSSDKYRRSDSRGGFVVRFSDSDRRVPVGSMGDGIWRVLGLALATVSLRGGVLLVDEIDTGLHFSTMSDIWKLLWKTAKRWDVQVFATTHNSDCWTSLASIATQENVAGDGITIQRIERGKETGVVFTEREIIIAAERGIEVR